MVLADEVDVFLATVDRLPACLAVMTGTGKGGPCGEGEIDATYMGMLTARLVICSVGSARALSTFFLIGPLTGLSSAVSIGNRYIGSIKTSI